MGSEEDDVCEEYASSLEDLTFNSKPLINVLTMLAEENSKFASKIVKLIDKRILEVNQSLKLPSLYLLDSIIKNVGGDYLHLVAQILERVFLCAFEGGNEKVRKDMYKLRNTWSQYFSAKNLHDLDVMVNKVDPGWPISPAPPPSPSIHVNPKFLKKVEDTSTAAVSVPPSADQGLVVPDQVLVESNQKLLELQRLQEEQLKLTEQEIQEHQLKRDLLLKKQQSERQLLLQQQQQQIINLRLKVQEKGEKSTLMSDDNSGSFVEPVATQAETTPSGQDTSASRDPRLRHFQHRPSEPVQDQRVVVLVDRDTEGRVNGLERPSGNPPTIADRHKHLAPAGNGRQRGRSPLLEDSVKDRVHREEKQQGNSPVYEDPKRQQRGERNTRGAQRGKGPEFDRRQRDLGRDDRKFRKSVENEKLDQREESRKRNFRGRDRNRGTGGRRGKEHDRYGNEGGRPGKPRFSNEEPRERRAGFEPRFAGPQAHVDRVAQGLPHLVEPLPRRVPDEPLRKKPKPLFPEHELITLRQRHGRSPPRGRATPPIQNHPIDHGHPSSTHEGFDFDDFDSHPPFHPDHFHQSTRPQEDHPPLRHLHEDPGRFPPPLMREEMGPAFEIPKELMLDQQAEIMRQAENRLTSGDMTKEQHHELVERLQQLYELQRQKERLRQQQLQQDKVPSHGGLHHPLEGPPHSVHPDQHLDHPPFQAGPREPFISDGPPRGPWPDEPVRPQRMGPQGHPAMAPERPGFGPPRPLMDMHNEKFLGPPMEHEGLMDHSAPMEGAMRSSGRLFEGGPRLGVGLEGPPVRAPYEHGHMLKGHMGPRHDVPVEMEVHEPLSSAMQEGPSGSGAPPQMEKKNVDDLFRRLVQVGVIKVMPEPRAVSPVPIRTPPLQAQPQPEPQPQAKPGSPKKETSDIPELKLVPFELKKRYEGVIKKIYDGTQCSSCGLRFAGKAAAIYPEHLDWHFRKNRRERDGRHIAYRQWFIGVKDWVAYEEITDPEEKAHSSFFDQTMTVASPDKSTQEGEHSCPVLDGESDMACDICCEKFEQFWEETNEEWHYKGAVREHGKTYHVLCLQDAKENQGTQVEVEEDDDSKFQHAEDDEQTEEAQKDEVGEDKPNVKESDKEVSTDNGISVIKVTPELVTESKSDVSDAKSSTENKDRQTQADGI